MQRRSPPTQRAGGDHKSVSSDRADVLSFLTFTARSDVEFDELTLFERLETVASDVREVNEYVVTAISRNEAEALFVVEELHCSLHKTTFASIRRCVRSAIERMGFSQETEQRCEL